MAHNGEINTLRGNINWMHARQAMFESELFGEDIKKILPIISVDGSDPPCSTIAWSCWSWPGAPCRTR